MTLNERIAFLCISFELVFEHVENLFSKTALYFDMLRRAPEPKTPKTNGRYTCQAAARFEAVGGWAIQHFAVV